jgi:signal transduction histidine kinase
MHISPLANSRALLLTAARLGASVRLACRVGVFLCVAIIALGRWGLLDAPAQEAPAHAIEWSGTSTLYHAAIDVTDPSTAEGLQGGTSPHATSSHAQSGSNQTAAPIQRETSSQKPAASAASGDGAISWFNWIASLPPARARTDPAPAYKGGLLVQRSAAELINRELMWRAVVFFTGFGLYLLIALSFLVHWIHSRRDVGTLAIALLALVMAGHTIAISGVVEYLNVDALNQRTVATAEVVTYLLLNGLIALVLWTFFPSQFRTLRVGDRQFPPPGQPITDFAPSDGAPKWIQSLNTTLAFIAIVGSIVFALVPLFAPGSATNYVLSASRWITLLLMVVAVAATLHYVEQRSRMTGGLTVGMGLIVVGSMHDVLFAGGDGHPYLITYTFLGFLLLQGFTVARRNVKNSELARRANEDLSIAVAMQTKELRAASIAAQAANLAKSHYLSAVSHELRTPLTSMLGFTQILRHELDEQLNEQQEEFFDTIASSGERLLSLINDLLDLAKMEAGHIELTIEAVEVGPLLADVATQLTPLARQKNLSLSVSMDEGPLQVQADEQRLRQVLLNLVSNAIKFTDRGRIRLHAFSTVVEEDGPAVEIAVEDTGTGISPRFLPHLFDRFTQEPREGRPGTSGTGLGLTISRELITRMGGHIYVESTVGAGSTFSVVLPAA